MPTTDGPSPRIHYEIRGREDAPILVMLRGLGRSRRHWGGVSELLELDFRLLLVDNRGVGKSDVVRAPYTTAEMAADVVRVLDHAEVPRAHVFGMSLGGMIAQELAIEHPGRVDRLVLGCTTPGGKEALRGRLTVFVSLASARLGDAAASVAMEARFLLSGGFRERRPEVLDQWVAIAAEEPVARATMALQLLAAARHDASQRLHRITAPTLIVSSDRDDLIPPENSRLLARAVAGAEIAWVAGAAHDFATERPDETARLLRRFLRP
jgi:3-oxoadipate enol-lactonase